MSSDDDDIPDPSPFPKTYGTDLDIAFLTGTLISQRCRKLFLSAEANGCNM